MKRILVTGGAGFVGSHLALSWKRDMPDTEVIALDNLKRRGSELQLSRLKAGGVLYQHGDVRNKSDLAAIGPVDLLIECSAEPSVHAGQNGDPGYLIDSNLGGALHCLDHLRQTGGELIFLSSSRVYSINALRALPLMEGKERMTLYRDSAGPGWSHDGIAEDFSLAGPRSLYGSTKLSAEMFIEEYAASYGLKARIYRCGVLAGPWQMGKVDQGFVALWVARHLYGGALAYTGFGGEGLQVRDILHVEDLYRALRLDDGKAQILNNLGGGMGNAVSLQDMTRLSRAATGNNIDIGSNPETAPNDIPWYVSDNAAFSDRTGWQPTISPEQLVDDVCRWLTDQRAMLEPVFT